MNLRTCFTFSLNPAAAGFAAAGAVLSSPLGLSPEGVIVQYLGEAATASVGSSKRLVGKIELSLSPQLLI